MYFGTSRYSNSCYIMSIQTALLNLLLGYTRDALHQCSVFSDKKGTKEPVHSRDGGSPSNLDPVLTFLTFWNCHVSTRVQAQAEPPTGF